MTVATPPVAAVELSGVSRRLVAVRALTDLRLVAADAASGEEGARTESRRGGVAAGWG